MSIFKKLTTDGAEKVEDRLGGFVTHPTAVYDAEIKMAYAGKSPAGALNLTIIADLDGKEYRETIYVTNKGGENTYPDRNDAKKKHLMPGFITVNDLCLLTTGVGLNEQDTEEKMVKVYNVAEKKEVPTAVQALTGLIGQKVKLGILRTKSFKQKKNDSGVYVDTAETRMENSIDKVFHAESGRTVTEYLHEVEPGEFMPAWDAKNKGVDRDKTNSPATVGAGAGLGGSGRPGGLGAAGGSSPAKKSIFNK